MLQFGHIARHCRATKRCGHCAAAAHSGGESSCPVKKGATAKCVLCKGAHEAWARACPISRAHWDQARDAYQHRPAFFDIREPKATAAPFQHVATPVYKKRGRPAGSANQRSASQQPSASTMPSGNKMSTQTRLTQMLSTSCAPPPAQVPPSQVGLTVQMDEDTPPSPSEC